MRVRSIPRNGEGNMRTNRTAERAKNHSGWLDLFSATGVQGIDESIAAIRALNVERDALAARVAALTKEA